MNLHMVTFLAKHPAYASIESLQKCCSWLPHSHLSIVYDEHGTEYAMLSDGHQFNLFFTLGGYVGNITLR